MPADETRETAAHDDGPMMMMVPDDDDDLASYVAKEAKPSGSCIYTSLTSLYIVAICAGEMLTDAKQETQVKVKQKKEGNVRRRSQQLRSMTSSYVLQPFSYVFIHGKRSGSQRWMCIQPVGRWINIKQHEAFIINQHKWHRFACFGGSRIIPAVTRENKKRKKYKIHLLYKKREDLQSPYYFMSLLQASFPLFIIYSAPGRQKNRVETSSYDSDIWKQRSLIFLPRLFFFCSLVLYRRRTHKYQAETGTYLFYFSTNILKRSRRRILSSFRRAV